MNKKNIAVFTFIFAIAFSFLFLNFMPNTNIKAKQKAQHKTMDTMFIVPSLIRDIDQSELDNMFYYGKTIGIDNMVIQYSTEYYHDDYSVVHYADGGLIDKIMNSTNKYDIDIYFGTQIADDLWFNNDGSYEFLNKQKNISIDIIQDLYDKYYKMYPEHFKGYYLTFEIDNITYINKRMDDLITYYYQPVSSYIKNLNNNFDIMISPLTYAPDYSDPSDEQQQMDAWNNSIYDILNETSINIIAPQDCLGNGAVKMDKIEPWFASMKKPFDEYNSTHTPKHYWVNNENYDMNGTGVMDLNYFINNMNTLGKYTTNNISFSIHRLLPKSKEDYLYKYYDAYLFYYNNGYEKTYDEITSENIKLNNNDIDYNNFNLSIDYDEDYLQVAKFAIYEGNELVGEKRANKNGAPVRLLKKESPYGVYYKDPYGNKHFIAYSYYKILDEATKIEYNFNKIPESTNGADKNILKNDNNPTHNQWTDPKFFYLLSANQNNEIILELDQKTYIERLDIDIMEDRNVSIYLPNFITIYVSEDGINYEDLPYSDLEFYAHTNADTYELKFIIKKYAKYIKIKLNTSAISALSSINVFTNKN